MSDRLKVGILGGTGMVGQRFISLLENQDVYKRQGYWCCENIFGYVTN